MPDAQIRDAIILVAGTGSRLRPLTDTTHKCLLEVGGEPLVARLLRQLREEGIERAVMATGYLADQIRERLEGEPGLPELEYAHNEDYDTTNNAESLRIALAESTVESFLLCDGDILVRKTGWLQELIAPPVRNTLATIQPVDLDEEAMKMTVSGSPEEEAAPRVTDLSKKLDVGSSYGESVGVQTVAAETCDPLFERLENMTSFERADAYYENIFADLISDGHAFYAETFDEENWTEIDTVEDLEEARELYSSWEG